MKWPEWELLHVRQMKWLDMKILQVRSNKMARVASTLCKTNEISGYESASCKLKWVGMSGKYLGKTNETVRNKNTSRKVNWNENESEVLHVRQMKFLDIKILHVISSEVARVGSTSFKTNESAWHENSSRKIKWSAPSSKYFIWDKWNVSIWKYFM